MTRRAAPAATPHGILAGHPPEIIALCERLRTLITDTIPESTERAYPGWHGIGYRHPQAGYLGAIFPFDDLVKLGFEHGVDLVDPEGLLTGEGKQLRYVVLRPDAPVPAQAIVELLLEAANWRTIR